MGRSEWGRAAPTNSRNRRRATFSFTDLGPARRRVVPGTAPCRAIPHRSAVLLHRPERGTQEVNGFAEVVVAVGRTEIACGDTDTPQTEPCWGPLSQTRPGGLLLLRGQQGMPLDVGMGGRLVEDDLGVGVVLVTPPEERTLTGSRPGAYEEDPPLVRAPFTPTDDGASGSTMETQGWIPASEWPRPRSILGPRPSAGD